MLSIRLSDTFSNLLNQRRMKYEECQKLIGKIVYWDNEPVRIDSCSVEKQYGESVYITRLGEGKYKGHYASVEPSALTVGKV